MLVIPAVDISEGQAVRLRLGDMAQKTVYGDPVEFARRWADAGAGLIHLVDLDGAMAGEPSNLETVARIAEAVSTRLELGGGLRGPNDVVAAFDAGVRYAILGTSALRNKPVLVECLQRFGERIIVDIAARDGMVAVAGWVEDSEVSALELAQQVEALGARRVIFTDIATDGILAGPNIAATRRLAEAVSMEVVHSGGITTMDDIRAVAQLEPLGVVGVIVGRALYEGTVEPREALADLAKPLEE